MLAYHNDAAIKSAILLKLRSHAEADEFIKGKYWENGKGCAVGCTIESDDHAEYEKRFGIPQMLARLEDSIFEGLPNGEAKLWPEQFMGAIKPGSDLSRVGWQFLHWILTDSTVNPGIEHELVRDAVKQCADVIATLAKGSAASGAAYSAAASASYSAFRAAASASYSADSAAASAAYSADSAAYSAAYSADSAADSADSASRAADRASYSAADRASYSAADSADSASRAADRAASAASAADRADRAARAASAASAADRAASAAARAAARAAAYQKMSIKLIALLDAA